MLQREQYLHAWVQEILGERTTLVSLAGDASFRKYYRAERGRQTWVVMDAPPSHENTKPFIAVAKALAQVGLSVPTIVASDIDRGFLLLSDLGDRLYLDALTDQSADPLYSQAIEAIARMQRIDSPQDWILIAFDDAFVFTELNYFREWFLQKYLGLKLSQMEETLLARTFESLAALVQEQPMAFVHRDYHSRNLMVLPTNSPGILDFQDAVWGPITYDLVSLLKDCYIQWPRERVLKWAQLFWATEVKDRRGTVIEWDTFLRWFDVVGIQRHLKVLGIFARLYLRDGKARYLADLPRIIAYLQEATALYSEWQPFNAWLTQVVVPRSQEKLKDSSCVQ